jgi:hypothetical protein
LRANGVLYSFMTNWHNLLYMNSITFFMKCISNRVISGRFHSLDTFKGVRVGTSQNNSCASSPNWLFCILISGYLFTAVISLRCLKKYPDKDSKRELYFVLFNLLPYGVKNLLHRFLQKTFVFCF